jgi:ectoine hydroxylase-related dioxygenase (phytanoyl-CoA dioxygenase family)
MSDVRHDGYAVVADVLDRDAVDELRAALAAVPSHGDVRRRRSVYGMRHVLEHCPAARAAACSPSVRALVDPVLGPAAFAVRATLFDKPAGANWSLFWHQDNAIEVAERIDAPGFGAWSNKSGVWQTQPPVAALERMLAVRIALDDNTAHNGPLRVLPGSHSSGWITDTAPWKSRVREVVCTVASGDAVLMRPLLLHASAHSTTQAPRRVVHFDFAAHDLPSGLRWARRVCP